MRKCIAFVSLPSRATFVLDPVGCDSKVFDSDFVVENRHFEISYVSDFEPLLINNNTVPEKTSKRGRYCLYLSLHYMLFSGDIFCIPVYHLGRIKAIIVITLALVLSPALCLKA